MRDEAKGYVIRYSIYPNTEKYNYIYVYNVHAVYVFVVTLTLIPGNTKSGGRLGTIDLLIRVACLVKKLIMFSISKALI